MKILHRKDWLYDNIDALSRFPAEESSDINKVKLQILLSSDMVVNCATVNDDSGNTLGLAVTLHEDFLQKIKNATSTDRTLQDMI